MLLNCETVQAIVDELDFVLSEVYAFFTFKAFLSKYYAWLLAESISNLEFIITTASNLKIIWSRSVHIKL